MVYFLLAKLALNAEVYTDNNWIDGVCPNGKDIYFTIDGRQVNALQAVTVYCDLITALGYRLESEYETNFIVYNELSIENIFTIPMNKTLYTD